MILLKFGALGAALFVISCGGGSNLDPSGSGGGDGAGCPTDCDDGVECTADACVDGSCVHTPAEAGTACSEGACDGAASCVGGSLAWVKLFGDGEYQFSHALAVSATGDLVVAGEADPEGTIDFGTGPIAATDYSWMASLALADGAANWAFASPGWDGLGFAAAGAVVALGNFTGTFDAPSGPLQADADGDVLVLKRADDGAVVWATQLRIGGDDRLALAVGPDGSSVLAGWVVGEVDLGGGSLVPAGTRLVVGKLNAEGTHLWSKLLDITPSQAMQILDVAVAPSGDILLGGAFEGSATLGGFTLAAPPGVGSAFLAKLDGLGDAVWAKHYEPSGPLAAVRSIAIGVTGDVAITGQFAGQIDLGGGGLGGPGTTFVAMLDGEGGHVWSRAVGNSDPEPTSSLAVDGAGNVALAVVSTLELTMDLGGPPLTAEKGGICGVAKYGVGGTHLWSKAVTQAFTTDVQMLSDGTVVLTGGAMDGADFGAGPMNVMEAPGALAFDAFVAVFNP